MSSSPSRTSSNPNKKKNNNSSNNAVASKTNSGFSSTKKARSVVPVAASAAKKVQLAASMVTSESGELLNPETDTTTSTAFRDRCNLFSVECEEFVVWRKWAPGGEYKMVWRIKNLSDVAQVIQYRLPQHKATFFVEFPEPVTLATGTYFDLPILFRPHELTSVRDQIEVVIGKKGSLQLQLVAVTPYQQLGVPEKLDMGLVASGVRSTAQFAVSNVGTADINGEWEVAEPFIVTPSSTVLAPGENQTLTLSVNPEHAQTLVTRLVCRDINTETCVGHFNASCVSKYPFVMLKNNTEGQVDFNSVYTGTQSTRTITLDNASMVPAHFIVVRADSDVVNPFSFSPQRGTIPQGGKIGFSIKFHPESPGATYRNVYQIRIQGGNTVSVTCSGTSSGANLSLSMTSMDFGDVPVYTNQCAMVTTQIAPKPVKKLVTLRNTGSLPAEFKIAQFNDNHNRKGGNSNSNSEQTTTTSAATSSSSSNNNNNTNNNYNAADLGAGGNVFTFDVTSGVVGPKSSKQLCVSFLPPSPINYLRRTYILVCNGEAALSLDLFGTGYSNKIRPAPFNNIHVRSFFNRIDGGLGRYAPEELAVLSEKLRHPELVNSEDEDEVAAVGALAQANEDLFAAESNVSGGVSALGGGLGSSSSGTTFLAASAGNKKLQQHDTMSRKSKTMTSKSGTKSSSSVIAPKVVVASGRKIDTTRGHANLSELPMLMRDNETPSLPFTLDRAMLVFKQPGGNYVDEQQVVTVYNHTSSKATASWISMLHGVGDDGMAREEFSAERDQKEDHFHPPVIPWSVQPAVADVPPHGSTQFFVSGNRDVNGVTGTFAHYLECFVSFKQMRTFRLVNDETFAPPVCLVLECERLVPINETAATPECQLPSTVAFPAQLLHHSTYQVIALRNQNETHMSFSIDIEEVNKRMLLQQFLAMQSGGGGGQNFSSEDLARLPDPSRIAASAAAAAGGGNNNNNMNMNFVDNMDANALEALGGGGEAFATGDRAFTCFPQKGSIAPKDFALIVFRFRPTQKKRYRATAIVNINDVSFGNKQISLRGEGFQPQIVLSDNNVLIFRPTAVGARSVREYKIHNPSRVNVDFSFDVPDKLGDIFRIEPAAGILGPNEQANLSATFAPGHVQKYEGRIPVTVRSPSVHDSEESIVYCTAVGEGCTNVLQVEPINLDLGNALVGEDVISEFTIFNVGICDVYFEARALMANQQKQKQHSVSRIAAEDPYSSNSAAPTAAAAGGGTRSSVSVSQSEQGELELDQHQLGEGAEGGEDTSLLPHVELNPSCGFLRARSHIRVLVKTRVVQGGSSDFAIAVVHHGSQQIVQESAPTVSDLKRLPHVNVQVAANYPTVEFCDVRCASQRKSRLWRQMSFDAVNSQLARPVESCDCEKESFDFAGSIAGLQPNVCDLGVDVIRTAPIRVLTCIKSKSAFPVKFAFWFADQQVGTEDLASLEDADQDSASLVADRSLFSIEPREGTIYPGESMSIVFSYKHCHVGSHATPVILQIENGKRILLHLTARTLAENEKFLSFHFSREHIFAPVAVGDMEPPLQYMELQNVGYESVDYIVDQEALIEQRDRNGDFPIMHCLNPQGTVPPLSTLLLCWCFRPLEKKKYEVTIQIHVDGGDSYPLKLVGEGYHPSKVPLSEVRELMESKSFAPIPASSQLLLTDNNQNNNQNNNNTQSMLSTISPLAPVQLSWDVLRFGVIPMHSLHRRVLVLHNTHPRDTYLFEWNTVMQFGDHIVEIDPPRGRIKPGERVTARVSLYAGSTAQLIDLAVSCHILNEDLRNRRLKARAHRSHRAAESLDATYDTQQQKESVGLDDATVAAKRERNRQRAAQRMPLTTIPPAFQSAKQLRSKIRELTDAAAAEELSEDDPRLVFVDVVPGVVEVLLQTYIVDPDSYNNIFGHAPVSFFPTLAAYATPVSAQEKNEIASSLTGEELQLAQEVVAGVLQQVVHHKKVRDATADISEDPVPYFYEVSSSLAPVENYRSDSYHQAREQQQGGEGEEEEEQEKQNQKEKSSVEQQQQVALLEHQTAHGDAMDGFLRCLAEEIAEDLIFGMLLNPRDKSSLVASAAKSAGSAVAEQEMEEQENASVFMQS